MTRNQLARFRGGLLLAMLGACPLPSYALADNIISQVLGIMLFIACCVVATIATLGALLALVTGKADISKKSALVAALALGIGFVVKPAPSYVYQSPEEVVTKISHPFGLVMRPDTTDVPMPLPPLRKYDPAADSTQFDKLYTYAGSMPQLVGGNTEAIRFVQKYLRYPADARQHQVEGVVVVSFVVDEAGEVHNTRVTRRLGYGCDEEALRIVRGLPVFQNSAAVPVQLTWLFSFCPPEQAVPR